MTSNRRLGMRDPRVTGTAGRDILGKSSALEVDGSTERITVDRSGTRSGVVTHLRGTDE